MAHFTVENLQKDRLGEAWPVVRTSGLEANLDWWLTDAAGLIDRGGGVLVARAPNGSIHGVAAYEAVHRPPLAGVLAVEMLITFELNRRAPARRSLCEALEQVAMALNCTGLDFPLSIKAA